MIAPIRRDRAVLLPIDLQVDFFTDGPLAEARPALVTNVNRLTRAMRPGVIWVRQVFKPDLSDAPALIRRRSPSLTIAGTPGVEFLPDLIRDVLDGTLVKRRYSAFFRTGLIETLRSPRWNADTVIVCGVNTHACVRMTVIDAYQHDLRVIVARDAVSSWDAEHAAVTLKYLDGIAEIGTTDEIIAAIEPETP